jgi:hypothetical protein
MLVFVSNCHLFRNVKKNLFWSSVATAYLKQLNLQRGANFHRTFVHSYNKRCSFPKLQFQFRHCNVDAVCLP